MSGWIRRDDWGIPHLWGDDPDQLAYLQGRAAALDRAWQLEVERWRGLGDLAARLGAGALDWDRFARRAELAGTARRGWAGLDAATRRWLAAYSAGVNSGLPAGARAAQEFAATGARPGCWQPWTPLLVFLVQHILFSTLGSKLWREHLAGTLGEAALALFRLDAAPAEGSNAWAVAGTLTASGAPLLAGDPHRLIEAPGIYQQVHLACPQYDVVGFTFPGVPGVQHFGHTGTVAWAVTNAMADYQDLYRERLRRDGDRVLALGPDGWEPVARRVEPIAVRDAAPEAVEVLRTARGPLILGGADAGTGLSLRTPADVHSDLGFAALPGLLAARTASDVERALRAWVEPVNSLLVADSTGAVRRLVAGRVPVRAAANRVRPVPAWEPANRWAGGYEPMPSGEVAGYAVAANDRRPGDTAELGHEFAPPYRARRIRELLAGRRGLTPDDVAGPLTDTRLGSAEPLQALLRGLPGLEPGPAALRDRLLRWDGRMDAGSHDAALFAAWRAALVRRLAGSEPLRPLSADPGHPPLFRPWLDPLHRVGLALPALLRDGHRLGLDPGRAAAEALAEVADTPDRPWGARHRLEALHVLGTVPGGLPDPPLGGDEDCVLATGSVPGDRCRRGPVARYVWDLADRSASRWVVPLGASGRWHDPHSRDQLPRWAAGELVPVVTDPDRLTLEEQVPVPDIELDEHDHTDDHADPVRAVRGGLPEPLRSFPLARFGLVTLPRLEPDRDAELVHGWVRPDRARFWGMRERTVEEVRDIYRFVDGLDTHHAHLIRLQDEPIGLLQTYDPAYDPIGDCYPVRPGDLGLHLLLAPAWSPGPGFTRALARSVLGWIFDSGQHQRLVAEPDAGNDAALHLLRRLGFELAGPVDLPDKQARLALLTVERFRAGPHLT